MAKVSILSWAEIPSVVEARDGEGRHKVELSARFQELIDLAAMRRGLAGTDAYLEAWQRGRPSEHPGSARQAADAVAADLERRFEDIRTGVIASFGP